MRAFVIMGSMKKLFQLFLTNFIISMCTFGGGYVIAGFMKDKFVDQLHWIDQEEMLDMIALAQSAPGAIAVNTSVLVGWKIGGFWGMIASVLGTSLPPMLVIIAVFLFYSIFIENSIAKALMTGMQAGVCAVILSAVVDLVKPWRREIFPLALFAAAFVLAFFFRINVIFIVLGGIVLGVILAYAR